MSVTSWAGIRVANGRRRIMTNGFGAILRAAWSTSCKNGGKKIFHRDNAALCSLAHCSSINHDVHRRKVLNGSELREAFLNHWVQHTVAPHVRRPSAPLWSAEEASLLFTAAGMVPYKRRFLAMNDHATSKGGLAGYDEAAFVSSQLCLRVGGAQNDVADVGRSLHHHTLFEMLGNFSFGSMSRPVVLESALKFVLQKCGIGPEHLIVTCHVDDKATQRTWLDVLGWPAERLVLTHENEWSGGPGFPSGFCTELLFDKSKAGIYGGGHDTVRDRRAYLGLEAANGSESHRRDGLQHTVAEYGAHATLLDRDFLELWNIVFVGAAPDDTVDTRVGVDTGMGLERIGALLQTGSLDSFMCDVFEPVTAKLMTLEHHDAIQGPHSTGCGIVVDEKDHGALYRRRIARRIVVDHARSVALMASSGLDFGPMGRASVMRRLLRRATMHAQAFLNIEHEQEEDGAYGVLSQLASSVLPGFYASSAFRDMVRTPSESCELLANRIERIVVAEERAFARTLDIARDTAERYLKRHMTTGPNGQPVLRGEYAFRLHDSHGIPLELVPLVVLTEGKRLGVFDEGRTADDVVIQDDLQRRSEAHAARSSNNFKHAVTRDAMVELSVACQQAIDGVGVGAVQGRAMGVRESLLSAIQEPLVNALFEQAKNDAALGHSLEPAGREHVLGWVQNVPWKEGCGDVHVLLASLKDNRITSILYPEGGGQVGDSGVIVVDGNGEDEMYVVPVMGCERAAVDGSGTVQVAVAKCGSVSVGPVTRNDVGHLLGALKKPFEMMPYLRHDYKHDTRDDGGNASSSTRLLTDWLDQVMQGQGGVARESPPSLATVDVLQLCSVMDSVLVARHEAERRSASIHHTCTHLLHHALVAQLEEERASSKEAQGIPPQSVQAGSFVSPDRLRFDFRYGHMADMGGFLKRVEARMHSMISRAGQVVLEKDVPLVHARERGARTLSDHAYPDLVSVMSVDVDSHVGDCEEEQSLQKSRDHAKRVMEVCAGTHASHVSETHPFVLVRHDAVSAGVRRLECLAGPRAVAYLQERDAALCRVQDAVGVYSGTESVVSAIEATATNKRELRKALNTSMCSGASEYARLVVNILRKGCEPNGALNTITDVPSALVHVPANGKTNMDGPVRARIFLLNSGMQEVNDDSAAHVAAAVGPIREWAADPKLLRQCATDIAQHMPADHENDSPIFSVLISTHGAAVVVKPTGGGDGGPDSSSVFRALLGPHGGRGGGRGPVAAGGQVNVASLLESI